MIETLYAIYKFLTDVPELINILLAGFTIAVPAKAYEGAEKISGSKLAGWAVGLIALVLFLVFEYVGYKYIGFPAWLGWIVERLA